MGSRASTQCGPDASRPNAELVRIGSKVPWEALALLDEVGQFGAQRRVPRVHDHDRG